MGGEEDPSEAQGSSDGGTLTPSVWRNVDTVAFAFALLQTHYVGNGIKLKSVALCRRVGRRPNLVEAKRSFCRTMRLFAFHVTTAIHTDLQSTVTRRVVAKVDAIIQAH